MEKRTAEIIMVLKGNSNLQKDIPSGTIPGIIKYRDVVALYLSDDCLCPFTYYSQNPGVIANVIQDAVIDYIGGCKNPKAFLYDFFSAQRLFPERDVTDWFCSALSNAQVRENGQYINGFTEENTKFYVRQNPFLLNIESEER